MSRGDVPIAGATFTAQSLVTLSSNATSANADVTTVLSIPAPDLNFSEVVNGTPSAAFLAPGPGNPGFVSGTHPALGDVIGTLSSLTNLGLTNNPCNNGLTVTFTFLNATVDNSSGNEIDPVPQASTLPGGPGVLDNQWSDSGASTFGLGAAAPWNGPWDSTQATANGHPASAGLSVAEQADGIPAQVQRYPKYLNTIFTPDGGSPVQPLARFAGATNVSGTSVILNLVVFAPGVLASAFPAPHPFSQLSADGFGYTSIAVLNNPVADAAPGAITDFCTTLTTTAVLTGFAKANPCVGTTAPPCNNQAGISKPVPGANTKAHYANPAAVGTYDWRSYHQSLRDADNDGKESAFDPCPTTADTFNQRTGVGADADGDGIPDACDTNGNGNADSDTDGWQNRGDNCPQNANATNHETENDQTYLVAAPDGGPKTDGMGDPCDPSPTTAKSSAFSGGSGGIYEATITGDSGAHCIGGTDGDGDGFCATGSSPASLNDPNDANSSITPEAYDLFVPMATAHSGAGVSPPMREPVQVCNDGIDNDGDTLVDTLDSGAGSSSCRPKTVAATPDSDGDGYSDEKEIDLGTDALGRCGVGGAPNPSAMWPSDFVSGGIPDSTDRVNITDLTSFLAPVRRLDTSPGNPNF
ncbi:MAG TPA: thrombospondin type 3 repeat-containing protein, partial [Dehalococcoidia bacterium]|nr:thrombospondin type 3 repeat-containing protein [Dehalococcoidia bacterium]